MLLHHTKRSVRLTSSGQMSGIMAMFTWALTASSLVQAAPLDPTPPVTNMSTSAYELIADYSGATFFDNFVTYTGADPNNGHVNYTDIRFAAQQGLVGFVHNATANTSSAYIGVDHSNQAPNGRNSVRLISKQTFNAGSMLVIDVNHIPYQYGLWPAIWLLGSGKDWPAAGESDILEYVHKDAYNAMTLHTSPGCSVSNSSSEFQGRLLNTDCSTDDASTGCSVAAYTQTQIGEQKFPTVGETFNADGGAVYVHDWQDDGITVWMFSHHHLPADLIAGNPQPATWKQQPLAKFSGRSCDFAQKFQDMQLIININFCGSWAGQAEVWKASRAVEETGFATCDEWVSKNPDAFKDSYFDIQSIRTYSNNGQKPGQGPTTFGMRKRDVDAVVVEASSPVRPLFHVTASSAIPSTTAVGFNGVRKSNVSSDVVRRAVPPSPSYSLTSSASSAEIGTWFFIAGTFALVAFLA